MIPIIYEATETAFNNNGLGRLTDCLSCVCTEERNGIFEVDFSYPVDGANFNLIQCGRIIGVTHEESDDIQPFDIVSYSAPINGIVEFHAVHISYRLGGHVVYGSNINSLADALSMLERMTPASRFTFTTDKTSTGYMAAADGKPRSVRQMLGGIDGSILDTYGGDYLFDKFSVQLLKNRGVIRDFSIRYGVNMLDYKNDTDYSGTYSSVIPYWSKSDQTVIGGKVELGATTYNEQDICVPLDLSEKFESVPTASDLQNMALAIMQNKQTVLPKTTINVDFIRLQDFEEYEDFKDLLTCNLCDTVRVEFPRYGMNGNFKIVKTVFDVLRGKYQEMELGALSTSLSEALGISNSIGGSSAGGGGGGGFTDISGHLKLGGAWAEIIKKAFISNGVVYYMIEASTSVFIANHQYQIATFDAGYRPKTNAIGNGYTTDGSFAPKAVVSVLAQSNGAVLASASNTTGSYFFVSGWFII